MNRVNLAEMFQIPETYQPPPQSELKTNTEYPNLNSLEYRTTAVDQTPKIQKYFECFDVNTMGNVILASNDLRGRNWNGSFWGFDCIEDTGIIDKVLYKHRSDANITNARYVDALMVLITDTSGNVELWSTQSEVRSEHGYCLFNIGTQFEHNGIINALDIFLNPNKAITGSSDGCLKIWDMGAGDIYSINTFRNAHTDSITGVSSSKSTDHIFASCSTDKTVNIWDYRIQIPVLDYNDAGQFGYTTVYWSRTTEHQELLFLGDETGTVHQIDTRNMSKIVQSEKYFDCPIHKFKFENSLYILLGTSRQVLVIDSMANDNKIIYKNDESKDYVRDAHWNDEKCFYTIGWEGKMKKHKLNVDLEKN